MAQRELEAGIHTDLRGRLTYSSYLCLDKVLNAQVPIGNPPYHEEMLFIIPHQTSELWMKLMIHELEAVVKYVQEDRLQPCHALVARVKLIQQQMISSWDVLQTLTPPEYVQFRVILRGASGFQSYQYRALEFMLGNKYDAMADLFAHDPPIHQWVRAKLEAPSLYDEFLRYLARHGHAVPQDRLERDWTQCYQRSSEVTQVIKGIYQNREMYRDEYELCELLADLEVNFQIWRFRHMMTVKKIIGYKSGNAGSSGVAFLTKALDLVFFPELFEVKSELA